MLKANTLAFVAVSLLAGIGAGCQAEENIPVAPDALLNMGADQMLIGIEHIFRQNGVRRAVMTADTVFMWDDSTSTSLRNLHMTSYSETGEIRATVTSERGTQDGDRMVARENVVLIIPEDNRRIESAELHYDPNGDRIWSDSATVMYEGDRIIRGTAFNSDLQFRNVTVQGTTTEGGGTP